MRWSWAVSSHDEAAAAATLVLETGELKAEETYKREACPQLQTSLWSNTAQKILVAAVLAAVAVAAMCSSKAVLTRISKDTPWTEYDESFDQRRYGFFKWSNHP
eukprot:TRINITY_DN74386_c0_g1_i1.p1 TRINITY_DN74386_c0_g1~~TRINITY_DN74386_c0_g1_i1.p1  ORF type:complete len:104 (+),score=23.30 TRINITY_DN74386_c0_g1_i1:108-419(+)